MLSWQVQLHISTVLINEWMNDDDDNKPVFIYSLVRWCARCVSLLIASHCGWNTKQPCCRNTASYEAIPCTAQLLHCRIRTFSVLVSICSALLMAVNTIFYSSFGCGLLLWTSISTDVIWRISSDPKYTRFICMQNNLLLH